MSQFIIWKIKCVECKSEFYQDRSTIRNCEICRFKCSKESREKYNVKRRQERNEV